MSRIAITGASGFMGRHVVQRLAGQAHELCGISRDRATLASVPGLADRRVLTDWRDEKDQLTAALAGCETVIHLADNPDRRSGRATASERLASALAPAARKAGVGRLLFASSIYATAAESGVSSAYGQGKLNAESRFREEPGLHAIVLRLPPVYGPGSKGAIALMAGFVRSGIPIPFGTATALRDYLHVGNLAALVTNLVALPLNGFAQLAASIHEPSDGAPISTADLAGEIGRTVGRKVRLVRVPQTALEFAAAAMGRRDQVEAAFQPLGTRDQAELEKLAGWSPCADWQTNLRYLRPAAT